MIAALRSLHAPAGLVWRLLDQSDLDRVEALHRQSIAGVGVQAVKPETRDFFASLLGGRGQVIGLTTDQEAGQSLIAYGVLQHALKPGDSPLPLLGLPAHQPVLKLAGASVAPDWRRHGLQRLLIEARLRLSGDCGVVFSTAAPSNPASWSSLLACGFVVRGVQLLYGGHPRYMMVRLAPALDPHGVDAGDAGEEVDSANLERQLQLLAQGWRGVAAGSAQSRIRYQPCGKGQAA